MFIAKCENTFTFYLTARGSWSSSITMAHSFATQADARVAINRSHKRAGDRITVEAA